MFLAQKQVASSVLRVRYGLAMVLIACLASIGHWLIERQADRRETDGYTFSLIARQRTYSQRIAKAMLASGVASQHGDLANFEIHRDELAESLDLFISGHKSLVTRAADPDEDLISEECRQHIADLEDSYNPLVASAACVAELQSRDGMRWQSDPMASEVAGGVMRSERVYLPRMELVLRSLTETARERNHAIQTASLAVLTATICSLLLLVVLVFEPAVRVIRGQMEHLSRSAAEAVSASRAKGDFLANMSHEIRTPLTALVGFAELVADPRATAAERAEHAMTLRWNAEHLLSLINDVLDHSKIEAGRLTVESVRTPVVEIVSEVVAMLKPRANEHGVELRIDVMYPIPSMIMTDPTRLRQVLLNLVGNAIKFTQRGSVVVRVEFDASHNRMTFAVVDTGLGMSPEQRERLFTPFEQADASTSRRFGGTGLGLSISRRLAVLMGGDIHVTSELGKGSTFTLTLLVAGLDWQDSPTKRTVRADPAESSAPLAGVRVLLAEDGTDNQRLITYHLSRAGACVCVVSNGKEALEALRVVTGGAGGVDVVLLDMHMPEMDGYEAARRARASGVRVPIVAITASAMAGDRENCIQAGCDDYMTKPIDAAAMVAMVKKWSRATRDRAAA